MKAVLRLLLFSLMIIPVGMIKAADAYFSTQGGDRVHVDPNTNRATITRGGVTTPLWDGTHRMQDGSILIINKGTTVPNQGKHVRPELPRPEEWPVDQILGFSPCEKLVRGVCGWQGQCEAEEGCNLARQLLHMEQEERNAGNNRNLATYTSSQCKKVKIDAENFPECRSDNH